MPQGLRGKYYTTQCSPLSSSVNKTNQKNLFQQLLCSINTFVAFNRILLPQQYLLVVTMIFHHRSLENDGKLANRCLISASHPGCK